MTSRCPSTFNKYVDYDSEQEEPITLCRSELEDSYESSYVTMFNHITANGWVRRDRKWISPHYPEGNYNSILKAYEAQRVWEIANGRT